MIGVQYSSVSRTDTYAYWYSIEDSKVTYGSVGRTVTYR